MDVDKVWVGKLTPEQRAQLAKEGKCFYCKKKGHITKECPAITAKKTSIATTNVVTPQEPPKRLTGKEQYHKIQALINAMTEEEANDYYQAQVEEDKKNAEDFLLQDQ